jgi:hypothetical protein
MAEFWGVLNRRLCIPHGAEAGVRRMESVRRKSNYMLTKILGPSQILRYTQSR